MALANVESGRLSDDALITPEVSIDLPNNDTSSSSNKTKDEVNWKQLMKSTIAFPITVEPIRFFTYMAVTIIGVVLPTAMAQKLRQLHSSDPFTGNITDLKELEDRLDREQVDWLIFLFLVSFPMATLVTAFLGKRSTNAVE